MPGRNCFRSPIGGTCKACGEGCQPIHMPLNSRGTYCARCCKACNPPAAGAAVAMAGAEGPPAKIAGSCPDGDRERVQRGPVEASCAPKNMTDN